MGESEKPFACPSPGCNMSFTNEDHLVVHRKKHDMVLNLGSNGKNTFVADQTPTPTRFIRNCEEVGLFQDLQNVNPFEETFRRAVEAGKTGTLSETEVGGTDDTLHTPHIFPNITDVSASTVTTSVIKKRRDIDSSSINDKNLVASDDEIVDRNPPLIARQTSKNVEIVVESKKLVEHESNGIVVQEADTSITTKIIGTTPTNLTINGQEVQLLLKTADGKMMQLSAIPFCDNRGNHRINGKSQSVVIQSSETLLKRAEDTSEAKKSAQNSSGTSRMTIAKMRLKQALTKNGTIVASPTTNGISESPEKSKNQKSNDRIIGNTEQRRKQEVQARNRASSMRARAKRKAWIQQLQRTASNANEKNAALQLEVKALRSEVAKLRALLLAHNDCPVTKAMQKGSLVAVESKIPSTIVPGVQNIRTSPTNVSPRKRNVSFVEQPIAPKISKSSSSLHFSLTTKPPAILPKAEVKDHCPIIGDVSSLKILDVRSLLNVKEPSKRIVIMPNSIGRTLEIIRAPSRSIVQANTSTTHVDNDASKCTGT